MALSPMMQQYFKIKQQHPDHILFYRLGDFYEMFFEDAKIASKELELTLTGRDCGLEERAPMCGVPYHSCEAYIARLIKKGYKVAICEQLEDPATAKGVVKRDVIRVVTPGTITELGMLQEDSNNYIACIYCHEEGYGVCFADISTGEIHATELREEADLKLRNELGKFVPSEIIFNTGFLSKKEMGSFIAQRIGCLAEVTDDNTYDYAAACSVILKHFQKGGLQDLGLQDKPLVCCALGGLLDYLHQTQLRSLEGLTGLDVYSESEYMNLDIIARRNLEIVETMREKERKGTLLWVLDKTKTAMGKRLLRSYVEKPLINPTVIHKRLNAVEELVDNSIYLQELTECLSGIFDMERLITRIVYSSATPREVKSLQAACERLPALKALTSQGKAVYLREVDRELDELQDIRDLIASSILDEPAANLKEGGVICKGYCQELDELTELVTNTKGYIASIEAQEREKTGIKNLRIGYNRVFGYYLEVTNSFKDLVPDTYIRKQTLTNCERYITQELKELEGKVLSARERAIALESTLYEEIKEKIAAQLARVQSSASAIAKLDVYCSLAQTAVLNNYCRPDVNLSGTIEIQEGRHPVIEAIQMDLPFVSNDTKLNQEDQQIVIITGPNMAGKSTYMRQTALIVMMAQMGSFVPAKYASIGVVDGIYTRVGASDDLTSGQSTFMVEMTEVAHILQSATKRSLLILDEIGRGTSTYDGMSIARAVLEYIANKVGAKTLFATHYHEITDMENDFACVKNYNVAVRRKGRDITFLRRIVPGATDDSYGIYVSKLAGIPDGVIRRAYEILDQLESGTGQVESKSNRRPQDLSGQMMLVQSDDSELARRVKEVDLNTLTPIQAMNLLNELKQLV